MLGSLTLGMSRECKSKGNRVKVETVPDNIGKRYLLAISLKKVSLCIANLRIYSFSWTGRTSRCSTTVGKVRKLCYFGL